MDYKLILKVRDINGESIIIYQLRERKRIVKDKLKEAIREFKKNHK